MNFERWFLQRSGRLERWLITSSVMLILLLAAVQVLLTRPSIRQLLSPADRLEGVPIEETAEPVVTRPVINRQGYVELSIIDGTASGDLIVSVNGETVAVFAGKKSLTVPVRDGDLLEIDGSLPPENVVIAVTAVSEDIAVPKRGKEVVYFGRPETVSFISLRTDY